MKVPIITSCFNRAAMIRGAIESVLAQNYSNIEFIVVDRASTNGLLETIREYEDRISTIISEPDHGMYEAINKEIRVVADDVIGSLHSDSFFYNNGVISRIVKQMKTTRADSLYDDGPFVNPDNTDRIVRNWISGDYRLWEIHHSWLPLYPTYYIRREIMMRLGLYDKNYKIAADSKLLMRYLITGGLSVTYLKKYVVRVRMGEPSTDSARREKMWEEDIRVYSSHDLWPTLTRLGETAWRVPQFVLVLLKG